MWGSRHHFSRQNCKKSLVAEQAEETFPFSWMKWEGRKCCQQYDQNPMNPLGLPGLEENLIT